LLHHPGKTGGSVVENRFGLTALGLLNLHDPGEVFADQIGQKFQALENRTGFCLDFPGQPFDVVGERVEFGFGTAQMDGLDAYGKAQNIEFLHMSLKPAQRRIDMVVHPQQVVELLGVLLGSAGGAFHIRGNSAKPVNGRRDVIAGEQGGHGGRNLRDFPGRLIKVLEFGADLEEFGFGRGIDLIDLVRQAG
jgi:hypothetical protein